jgi:hypothetical protein
VAISDSPRGSIPAPESQATSSVADRREAPNPIATSADRASPADRATVDLESLLAELADATAPARVPRHAFTARLESSRDPRSVDPSEPEGWFANHDRGHARRVERFADASGMRDEWVIADLEGPGAIVRLWSAFEEAHAATVLRIRLDGHDAPVIEAPLQELLSGRGPVSVPIAAVQAPGGARWRQGVGGVMVLPVPFARRCIVTLDREPGYWQVAWRAYGEGTTVDSLPADWRVSSADAIARTVAALGDGPRATVREAPPAPRATPILDATAGERRGFEGPARTTRVAVRLAAGKSETLRAALRDLWLEADFDGEPCVRVPIGHFAGLGECPPPVVDRWRSARAAPDGTILLEWTMPMPFAREASIALVNRGTRAHRAAIESIETAAIERATIGAWRRLHAAFREDLGFTVGAPDDWSMLAIEGEGEIVAHTIAYTSGSIDWWGEGDEKIRVDGEALPSHFGTGTEDFIGTAWGFPRVLSSPFTTVAPRDDGARSGSRGRTTASRLRALDGIPFTRSVDLALERIPVPRRGGRATIAATTLWYAAPGASHPVDAADPATMAPNPEPPELARFVGGDGLWREGEELAVIDATPGLRWEIQEIGTLAPTHAWSGGRLAFIQSTRVGDHWSVEVPVGPATDDARTIGLELRFAHAPDYGMIDVEIDGATRRAAHSLRADEVRPGAPLVLDDLPVAAGRATVVLTLRVADDGGAPEAPRYIGFDAVLVRTRGDAGVSRGR